MRTLEILKCIVKECFAFWKFSHLSDSMRDASRIPRHFVDNLIKLGPTFVKLGQILSTRPDMLPRQYIEALARLHESVPPFDFTIVEQIVVDELKKPLLQAYTEFNPIPVASASLSQVHFAVMPTGEEVAVKVQRPRLLSIFEHDLAILSRLLPFARLLNRRLYDNMNVSAAFSEFKRYTMQEIDFMMEGKTYDRFRATFEEDVSVIFPKVFWSHTTTKVLTMSRESGMRLHEAAERISTENKHVLFSNIVRILIQMFVRDGFFHADLHPGNIFFKENGTMVMLDVGMFGELAPEERERFILYWLGIVLREDDRAFHHLLQLTTPRKGADKQGYFKAYERILENFYSSTLKEKSLTQTYLEIMITGARYGYVFPSVMLLQAKALTTAEYIGYVLDPDFNFADTAKPHVTDALNKRFTDDNFMKRLSRFLPEWLLFGENSGGFFLNDSDEHNEKRHEVWRKGSRYIADRMDEVHFGDYDEIRHGKVSIEIDKDLETVFNFFTRFAQYPLWHPVYTEESHVIHVSGKYVFITPEAIGSVFRLDEIVDGYHLLSNGVITEFERNKLFKWKAPFSLLPIVELGTCFEFEEIKPGKTIVSEYFYFSENPVKHLYVHRKWFSSEALEHHMREEITGGKNILESGNYVPDDIKFLWEGVEKPRRFM